MVNCTAHDSKGTVVAQWLRCCATNGIMLFACEIIQLFSVLFCLARAVHKFDVRPVINDTPDKWGPVEIR